ncbi:uncharacterized protein LOC107045140 [Diachasma alloeum]|uniref:uncharacterized protein LOC107045140 n=1 Tax=Diachasma alloeum TaxID=454923 RepID=UPI000738221D|nr:uncharacterized protein LOC107045140 [Diachasma alloeum]
MYILLRFFNNVILMLINFLIAIYFGRRFFIAMTRHYKIVSEITEFNSIVREARDSLDYVTTKIAALMKDIEGDIAEELHVTHNLTKLSSKTSMLLKRYGEVEDRVLELVRMNENMANVQLETPDDIKSEMKRTIMKIKKEQLGSYTKSMTPNSDNVLT